MVARVLLAVRVVDDVDALHGLGDGDGAEDRQIDAMGRLRRP